MPTFADMISEVATTLHGFTADLPAAVTLIGSITPSATSMSLDFGSVPWAGRPNGLVEIDDELIFVSAYDASTQVATIPAWGRAQNGTVAASHNANAKVVLRPRYSRAAIKRAINATIRESCPPLFAAVDLPVIHTGQLVQIGYALPDNTIRVLRVEATDSMLSLDWAERRVLKHWTVRAIAGQQLLQIPRGEVYQDVQVTVATAASDLVNPTDDFATVTGLPDQASGMVVFGALARLVLGAELAKQQPSSVEAAQRSDKIQMGSATTVSRYYQALYQQRLEFVRDLLAQQYPPILLRRG